MIEIIGIIGIISTLSAIFIVAYLWWLSCKREELLRQTKQELRRCDAELKALQRWYEVK